MIVTPEEDARLSQAEATGPVAQLRQAADDQALLERISFASKHGLSYGGERDLNLGLGRVTNLDIDNYRARFRRGGIFKRLIKAAPKATWVSGATIQEDPDPENQTDFEAAVLELFKRLHVWSRLLRADILAGLGRYSVLMLGGEGKASELEKELSFGSDGPTFLRPLAEDRARILEIDEQPESERFGRPEIYGLTLDSSGTARKGRGGEIRVHWSRMIHIVDGALESDVYGSPRGEAVWDLFDDLYKVVGGGAEAAWKGMDPGLNLNIDPELPVSPADAKKLKDEILAYQHDPRQRFFLSRGVEINQLTPSIMNFGPNSKSLLELIAGTEEIPLRILLGSERGELASSQDERNWNQRIGERWVLFADPVIRDLVDRFIKFKALPKPSQYSVIRQDAVELDDEERAALVSKIASANKSQVDAGDTVFYTSEELRHDLYGKDPLEVSGGDSEPAALRGAAGEGAEFDAVREAALSREPAHEAAWRRLWAAMADALPTAATLEAAIGALDAEAIRVETEREIESGEPSEALDRLLADPLDLIEDAFSEPIEEFEEPLAEILLATLVAGGEGSLDAIDERGSFLLDGDPAFAPAASGLRTAGEFETNNPRAIAWASEKAAATVIAISTESRETIRTVIASSLSGEISIPKAASRIRATVGLRVDQTRSILALGERLATARPGTTVRKGGLTFKVPQSGATERFLERSEARYTTRSLRIRAELIRRTETAHAANTGLRESWRQAIDSGQLPRDGIKRVWIHSGAARPRQTHLDIDGEEVGIEDSFSVGTEPGEEPNCILPGASVSGAFVSGLKSLYAGPAVAIKTRSGYRLRLTINHPVLTAEGWIPAGRLSDGMNLLSYGLEVKVSTDGANDDDPPAHVEHVFETLALRGDSLYGDPVTFDLHGDERFLDGQVHIVGADRELAVNRPAVAQGGSDLSLPLANPTTNQVLIGRLGSTNLSHHRIGATAPSFPGRAHLSSDRSPAAPLDLLPLHACRFGLASKLNIVKPEPAGEGTTADADFAGELVDRSAGLIAFDEVVEVRDFDFRGHVFDLQSLTGWLSAESIIISNCGCSQGLVVAG